jgi:AraC-like DNA-binding protein
VDSYPLSWQEENLAMQPNVRISASNPNPVGGGARLPAALLNEIANRLDGRPLAEFNQGQTFDTFHGRTASSTLEWYCLEFPVPTHFNCIELTMGWPYRDGGWWKSVDVEIQLAPGETWQTVRNFHAAPDYNFSDSPQNRRPYETYLLSFDDTQATAVRLIGAPGGLASFTSLARLAVYHRDFSRWNPSRLPAAPLPDVFKFISPATISDLSESLVKLSGLQIYFPLVEYYLDETRHQRFWKRMQDVYLGKPTLYILLGDTVGWANYGNLPHQRHKIATQIDPEPYVDLTLNGSMASAMAPIVVEDHLLASLTTEEAILRDHVDWEWHRRNADQTGIPWQTYQAALERSPHMTLEQMEGIAEMMGMIANNIAHLAHRNQMLENELRKAQSAAGQANHFARETIDRAIGFMQENLEEAISMRDVARAVSLNPCYFSTLFAGQMGCTPSDFFTRLRIERAKEYLRHTSMSVMDICVALDYNPSYFNRLFKKMTGETPGRYARQVRQGQ